MVTFFKCSDHGWASYNLSKKILSSQKALLPCWYFLYNVITGQAPKDICNQPIFASTRQIQWRYPGGYQVDNFSLVVNDDFIRGSVIPQLLGIRNLSIWNSGKTIMSLSDLGTLSCIRSIMKTSCRFSNDLSRMMRNL